MASETPLYQLPGKAPNERVLVCLVQTEGASQIALRQQHWAHGIGWYDQHVMRFDARQWEALRRAVHAELPAGAVTDEAPATIPFPGPNDPVSPHESLRRIDHA